MPKKKKDSQQSEARQPDAVIPEAEPVEEVPGDADGEGVQAAGGAVERELEQAREEAQRNHDQYLRVAADLENFRKRAQREKEELSKFANERILREILPVVDNLERAVEHARQENSSGEGLLEGVEMTLTQFGKVLEKFGVTPVSSIGEPFDPARHEAVGQLETAEHAPNVVAQELQKGYLLHERLLRPAMVLVAKPPADDAQDEKNGKA
ncbi:MAG: nucleotide exchange factor GrpE [Thermodesulfobacteriota bacterium]|nr:nucleotide exchange factor GrpE [Thermodesulfobacteriota bacterium]